MPDKNLNLNQPTPAENDKGTELNLTGQRQVGDRVYLDVGVSPKDTEPKPTDKPFEAFLVDPGDDMSAGYMERRENSWSPELTGIMTDPEVKGNFDEMMKGMGKGEGEIQAEMGGLEQPWVDPIMAFSGSFGAGALLTKTLVKPLITSAITALAEYPIGQASDIIGEKYPNAALPFNIAFGVLSGVTVENKLQEAIVKGLKKAKVAVNDGTIAEALTEIGKISKQKLTEQRGSVSGKPPAPEAGTGPKTSVPPSGEQGTASPIQQAVKEIIPDLNKQLNLEVTKRLENLTPQKVKVLFDIAPTPQAKAGAFQIAAHEYFSDVSDLPQKAININFRNIESPEDIQALIYQTSKAYGDEIQEARRGIQTNEQTSRLADNLGMDTDTLLRRQRGQSFNAEQAYAARNLLVSSATNLKEAAQRAVLPTASEIDKFEFRKLLNLHYAIQAQVSGMTAEAGRALQQFRMKAASQEGMVQQLKDSMAGLQSLEKGGTTEDLAAVILTLDEMGKVSRVVRKLDKPSSMKMIVEFWINSILSGPMTHAVNMTSNTLTNLIQVPERFLAAGIGKALPGQAEIDPTEAFHLLAGIKGGLEDGFRLIAKTSAMARNEGLAPALSKLVQTYTGQTGKIEYKAAITGANMMQLPVGKFADKVGMGGPLARAADIIGEVVRVPGTALQFEDAIFKGIGYRMELNARAFRMARAEGLEGKALSNRIASLLNDPPDELTKAAMDHADYVTYTKELGEFGTTLTKLANIYPAARFVLPFIRTPANIFKFFGERTPLGLLAKSIRDDIAGGGAERDMALSRMALGSAIMALVGWQTMEGNITGGGPTDDALQATWRRTGWQPYSFRFGEGYPWLSYARFEPFGTLVGTAADIGEIYSQYQTGMLDDDNALLYAGWIALNKNVTNKTFLRGIADLSESLHDPERFAPSYASKFASSFIPNVIGQVNIYEVDPVIRQTRGIIDATKAKIPGLSTSVPPRRNLWGEEIVREGGAIPGIPDIVNPLFKSSDKNSPIDEEMKRLNIGASPVSRWINGVELLPGEYDRYQVLAGNESKDTRGRGLKDYLNEKLNDYDYKKLSDGKDGGKADFIRKSIQSFRDQAQIDLFREFSGLKKSILDHKKDKEQKKRVPIRNINDSQAPTFR